MDTKTINIRALAFLGDAVFSTYIREKLLLLGVNHPDLLQKKSTSYVSAKSQTNILKQLLNDHLLTDEEISIVNRGRNNKNRSHPKNTDIVTYKLSTGFEALIGDLYLNDKDRLQEILSKIEVEK